MSQLEDIRKISGHEIIFAILFISGAICPGIATIWFFAPSLLKDWGATLVILLSISITLPILSLNALNILLAFEIAAEGAGLFFPLNKKYPIAAIMLVAVAAIISMFIIGIPLLISFLAPLSLRTFSWIVLVLQIFFLLVEGILFRIFGRSEKEDKQKASKAT